MTQPLKCMECDNYARWHVWYKGVSLPMPFNIAYNSFCDEHACAELRNGREGWQVACVRLIAEQFLPNDDRARVGKYAES